MPGFIFLLLYFGFILPVLYSRFYLPGLYSWRIWHKTAESALLLLLSSLLWLLVYCYYYDCDYSCSLFVWLVWLLVLWLLVLLLKIGRLSTFRPWAPPGPDLPILGHPLKPIILLPESRPVLNIQALGASRARFPYSGPSLKTYHFLKRK